MAEIHDPDKELINEDPFAGQTPPEHLTLDNYSGVLGHVLGNVFTTIRSNLKWLLKEEAKSAAERDMLQIAEVRGDIAKAKSRLLHHINYLQEKYAEDLAYLDIVALFLRTFRRAVAVENWDGAQRIFDETIQKLKTD